MHCSPNAATHTPRFIKSCHDMHHAHVIRHLCSGSGRRCIDTGPKTTTGVLVRGWVGPCILGHTVGCRAEGGGLGETCLRSGGCRWAGRIGVSSAASTPPCSASSMFFLVGLLSACTHTHRHPPQLSNRYLFSLWYFGEQSFRGKGNTGLAETPCNQKGRQLLLLLCYGSTSAKGRYLLRKYLECFAFWVQGAEGKGGSVMGACWLCSCALLTACARWHAKCRWQLVASKGKQQVLGRSTQEHRQPQVGFK